MDTFILRMEDFALIIMNAKMMFVDYTVVASILRVVISVFVTQVMRTRKRLASTLMSVKAIHASVGIASIPKVVSNVNVRKASVLGQMEGKGIIETLMRLLKYSIRTDEAFTYISLKEPTALLRPRQKC